MKDIYKLYFINPVSKIPTIIKMKKLKPDTKHIDYNKKTYDINLKNPLYRFKNKFIYAIDINAGQMSFIEIKEDINPEFKDMINRRQIIKQIVTGLENLKFPLSESIIYILLSVGLGLAIGYIIGNFIPFTGGTI